MSARLRLLRAGPLTSVQDLGRPGMLRFGISASGPMDRVAFVRTGGWVGGAGGAGIEFTASGLALELVEGTLSVAWDGGHFAIHINSERRGWPGRALLRAGDRLEILPGDWGNYGYLRFGAEIELPRVLGSQASNSIAGLGGKLLVAGDELAFGPALRRQLSLHPHRVAPTEGPMRVTWGLHADLFAPPIRQRFVTESFAVSSRLDRMGVTLGDPAEVFAGFAALSLVSDAIVPGDIQIVGSGAPTVLMRDHQPTGGYPRLATVIGADLDRFAQLRPGARVRFEPVTVAHAQSLLEAI